MESPKPFGAVLQEWTGLCMRCSMGHLLHYARESGLSPSQIGALLHIHRRGVSGVTSVGGDLGVTSAAASFMLERLVRQGLVKRSENPEDRRAKQIVLTQKGQRVMHESIRARQEWLEGLAQLMTSHEQDQVRAGLTILIEKANQLEQLPKTCAEVPSATTSRG